MKNAMSIFAPVSDVYRMEDALLGGKIPAAKFRNQIKATQNEQANLQR